MIVVSVRTIGPAFVKLYGYVRYRANEGSRIRLAADGRSGVTLGPVDVLAPNLNTRGNPADRSEAVTKDGDQLTRGDRPWQEARGVQNRR